MNITSKTVIITDPCYVIANELDLERCDYGNNLEALGFKNYLCESTLFGNWVCTTYKTQNPIQGIKDVPKVFDNVIGGFCSIIGLVAVFELDEILRYNPDFIIPSGCQWATTIQNFTGTVYYLVGDEENCHVVGVGNTNFITIQSGEYN